MMLLVDPCLSPVSFFFFSGRLLHLERPNYRLEKHAKLYPKLFLV